MSSDEPSADGRKAAFKPAKPVRTYESIVQQIEEAIYSGQLQPGDRLPSERDLVSQFGVSRASIREALRVLTASGLIRSKPGDPAGGAEVLPYTSATLEWSLTSLVRRERLSLRAVVEFRMVIEGAATYLAARLRNDEQLQRMRDAHTRMGAAVARDLDELARMDAEFHQVVATAAGNELLRACLEVSRGMILKIIHDKRSQEPDSIELQRETLDRHGKMLAAIEAGDGPRAASRARIDLAEHFSPYMAADDAARVRLLASAESIVP